MKDRERVRQIAELWRQQQPPGHRTRDHVLAFYGWLQRNRPDLLERGHGDPYQYLQADLTPYIELNS